MKANLKIHAERCKECGLCISVCPKKIISFSTEINLAGYHSAMLTEPDKCISCGFCALMCPDVAIELTEVAKGE